ncbi:hypothetical protein [Ramlibacter sp. AN1133]|uniref:hypothetical protein n=1 Tax=Ramlibacter sp. AN1133 TaxID=3133429 RepID=UPI0030BC845D
MPQSTLSDRRPVFTGLFGEREPQAPAARRTDPCADERPACAACGGLQCLCRPRFFPGQLLSDEDLNRLQRYVIDKNRLHNRYLQGWGVACGLEVVCDPCASGGVIVRSGYALSPCGDDIVLCNDQAVDLCTLISDCRPQAEPVCDPPYQALPRECRGGTEEWVLAVCYDERPTRGITAMTGAGDTCACGGGCGCGGSAAGCSCGAGGSSARGSTGAAGCCGGQAGQASSSASSRKRRSDPQCEPTQVCEGHRFIAYRLPPVRELAGMDLRDNRLSMNSRQDLMFAWLFANRSRFGPLLERLLCCVVRALEMRATWREGLKYDADNALEAYLDYAEALREFAADFAIHRCKALAEITRLVDEARVLATPASAFDKLNAENAARKKLNMIEVSSRLAALDRAWMNLVAECLCSALLPACPQPAPLNCVPLAVLTVEPGDCKVTDICNWRERKLLINWQTVGYWLSWLPWQGMQEDIARMCCGEGKRNNGLLVLIIVLGLAFSGQGKAKARSGAPRTAPAPAPTAEAPVAAATPAAFGEEIKARTRIDDLDSAFEADNLVLDLMGRFDLLRAGAAPEAPGWAQLATAASDGSLVDIFATLAGRGMAGTPGVSVPNADLQAELASMKQQLAEHRSQIDALRRQQ